jgi:hypothetical protein
MTDTEYEKLRAEALRLIHDAEKRGQRFPRSRKFKALMSQLAGCRDCGSKDHEPLPMIKSALWLMAVPGGSGCLCQVCLEKRLGRSFVREDCVDPSDYDEESYPSQPSK